MPRYRHSGTGRVVVLPRDPGGPWVLVPDKRDASDSPRPYDPAEHSVSAVVAYLAAAGPRESRRVLALERRGKARRELLGDAQDDIPPME